MHVVLPAFLDTLRSPKKQNKQTNHKNIIIYSTPICCSKSVWVSRKKSEGKNTMEVYGCRQLSG